MGPPDSGSVREATFNRAETDSRCADCSRVFQRAIRGRPDREQRCRRSSRVWSGANGHGRRVFERIKDTLTVAHGQLQAFGFLDYPTRCSERVAQHEISHVRPLERNSPHQYGLIFRTDAQGEAASGFTRLEIARDQRACRNCAAVPRFSATERSGTGPRRQRLDHPWRPVRRDVWNTRKTSTTSPRTRYGIM